MPYATINGRSLFYTLHREGEPGHPPLVLVHGAGGSHLHWPAPLRRLPGRTVYTLDLPGHGRSEGEGERSIAGYAAVLEALLDALELPHAVIGGHSMGGAIAMHLALTRPERVAGLVLIGTGARLRVLPAILEGIQTDFLATVDLITRMAWSLEAPKYLIRRGGEITAQTPPTVLLGDFTACNAFDIMDRLDQIQAPTLVVGGTADRLTPLKYARYLEAHIPNARLVTIEGGGHMMMLEQPQAVAQAVADFLAGLDAEKS